MEKTISRVLQPDGGFIVHRVKNGDVEFLKETKTDTGEVPSQDNEMVTTQTIVITRRIGEKIIF